MMEAILQSVANDTADKLAYWANLLLCGADVSNIAAKMKEEAEKLREAAT